MDWYSRLYVSEDLKEKKEKLIDKIEHGSGTPGIYLVTLASNSRNLLDIMQADQLLWPVMHRICPPIIGISHSYEEAVDLASSVILESYEKTGSFQVEPFLQKRLKEGELYLIHDPLKKRKRRWGIHLGKR